MNNRRTINFGKFETACVLINSIIIWIFMGLPRSMCMAAGSAAWLVARASGAAYLVLLFIVLKLYEKNMSKDIFALMRDIGGRTLAAATGVVICTSFILKSAFVLRITSEIISTVLPFAIPQTVILVMLLVGAAFCAYLGLEGIVRLHALFVPVILLAFAASTIAAASCYDMTNLYPLWGLGFKNTAMSSLAHTELYSDFIYIFLLAPYVKKERVFKATCMAAGAVSAIAVSGLVLSYVLAVQYPENTRLFMPLYQLSRLIRTGPNSQSLEAFFLPVWMISSLLYISSSLYFAAHSLTAVFKIKRDKLPVLVAAAAVLIAALLPKSINAAGELWRSYGSALAPAVSLLAVLAAVVKKFIKR